MLSTELDIETLFQTGTVGIMDSDISIDRESDSAYISPEDQSELEGEIDYRIRQLSYSSLLTLHSCPRKFQLYKLRTVHRTAEDEKSTITFSFGHVVGEGIQLALMGKSEDEIIWNMFLGWHADLYARDDKLQKSFFLAVIAIQRFIAMREAGFLEDYELVYYKDAPACELSFAINFPEGFRMRGFVDAVLRHRISGKIIVLEVKTTGSATINPATYKNSAQAIGYSIVIDSIFPGTSSYDVLYLVYQTRDKEYNTMEFHKTSLQRAQWIRELLFDIEMIKMYESEGIYPMHGESCYSFFRECEYYNTCTLSTKYLTVPVTPKDIDRTKYQITLGLADLIDTQLGKVIV